MFGQTVTISSDVTRQFSAIGRASPKKWAIIDGDSNGGGIVPYNYRATDFHNAVQWAAGLELFLLIDDPSRVFFTTDHPNGAPYTAYPDLFALLMDRDRRAEWIAKLPPAAMAMSTLPSIRREYTFPEIAAMTRASPARLLGLRDRGHLAAGARADVAVYAEQPDKAAMFRNAAFVFKDGDLVVRDGRILHHRSGRALSIDLEIDPAIERRMRDYYQETYGLEPDLLKVRASALGVADPFEAVSCSRMKWNGVLIDDTFAEAFGMRAAAIVITADSLRWARQAAVTMTGYATSVIGCGCEAAIDRELRPNQTPDGRPGVRVLVFAMSVADLQNQLRNRVGQCVLTSPGSACYGDLEGEERLKLGDSLRYFGDGWQISKRLGARHYWRIPVMDGEFVCEATVALTRAAVGGGNLLILAAGSKQALAAAEAAVEAIEAVPDAIMPFPGGIARSGSKIGAKYKGMRASTNDAYCPTLRGAVQTALDPKIGSVLEIVIDGLTSRSGRQCDARGGARDRRAGRRDGRRSRQRRQLRRETGTAPLSPQGPVARRRRP